MPGDWRYRKCPQCADLMNRHNLGRGSGVIVDTCGTHGVWFDNEELHSLLDWVHRGGRVVATPNPAAARDATRRARAQTHQPVEAERTSLLDVDLEDVLAFALSLIFD